MKKRRMPDVSGPQTPGTPDRPETASAPDSQPTAALPPEPPRDAAPAADAAEPEAAGAPEAQRRRRRVVLTLFLTFLKIGAFTFGGGYAMISLIQRELVERRGWISEDDLMEIIAVAESTPGPIAVNSATFVGYRTAGFWGALCSTIGVVLPSFWVIVLISFVLNRFQSLAVVQYAFFGIRAGVVVLLVQALWSMFRQCPRRVVAYAVAAVVFLAVAVLDFEVLLVIVCAAAVGIVDLAVRRARKRGGERK